jgi:hypothetical protein
LRNADSSKTTYQKLTRFDRTLISFRTNIRDGGLLFGHVRIETSAMSCSIRRSSQDVVVEVSLVMARCTLILSGSLSPTGRLKHDRGSVQTAFEYLETTMTATSVDL